MRLRVFAVQPELRGFIPDSEEGTTKHRHTDKTGLSILFSIRVHPRSSAFIRVHPRSSVVKILPMEKGLAAPLRRTRKFRFAWLMQRGWKHPSPYRLGDLAVQPELRGFISDSEEGTTKHTKDTKGRIGLLGLHFHRSSFVYLVCFVVGALHSGFNPNSCKAYFVKLTNGIRNKGCSYTQSTIINPKSSIVNLTGPPPTTPVYGYCANYRFRGYL